MTMRISSGYSLVAPTSFFLSERKWLEERNARCKPQKGLQIHEDWHLIHTKTVACHCFVLTKMFKQVHTHLPKNETKNIVDEKNNVIKSVALLLEVNISLVFVIIIFLIF